jgi:hypothetical protein
MDLQSIRKIVTMTYLKYEKVRIRNIVMIKHEPHFDTEEWVENGRDAVGIWLYTMLYLMVKNDH